MLQHIHKKLGENEELCLEIISGNVKKFVNRKCLSIVQWEKAIAPHSSTLSWKILWTEEPGRLQSMWSLRVGHD